MKFTLTTLAALTTGLFSYVASADKTSNVRSHRDLHAELDELKAANRKLQKAVDTLLKKDEMNMDLADLSSQSGKLKPVGWNKKTDRDARVGKVDSDNTHRDLFVVKSKQMCYNDGTPPQVSVFNIAEILTFPIAGNMNNFEVGYIEYGFVDVYRGESVKVEVTVSTLLMGVIGGVHVETSAPSYIYVPFFGAKVGASITGITMSPFFTKCPDDYVDVFFDDSNSGCDEDAACLADYCRGQGVLVDSEPANTLPVNGMAIIDYDDLIGQLFWTGPKIYYEAMGQLNLETTTGKFFYGSKNIDTGLYLLDFGFSAFAAGIHVQLPAVEELDWTMQSATVGPHLIEVSKEKIRHGPCEYVDTNAGTVGIQDLAQLAQMTGQQLNTPVQIRTAGIAMQLGMPLQAMIAAEAAQAGQGGAGGGLGAGLLP